MLKLFRSLDHEHEQIEAAARRNDAAFAELKDALHRLLAERNDAGAPPRDKEPRRC